MLKLVLDHCSDFLHWNHVEAIWDCLAAPNGNLSGNEIYARFLAQILILCDLRSARNKSNDSNMKKSI